MAKLKEPIWHGIHMLSTYSMILDGSLEAAIEVHDSFREAQCQPYVLDDETLKRAIYLHEEQLEDHSVMMEQLAKWRAEDISDANRQEIARLEGVLVELKNTSLAIIKLAHSMKECTLNKVIEIDDLAFGRATLGALGKK